MSAWKRGAEKSEKRDSNVFLRWVEAFIWHSSVAAWRGHEMPIKSVKIQSDARYRYFSIAEPRNSRETRRNKVTLSTLLNCRKSITGKIHDLAWRETCRSLIVTFYFLVHIAVTTSTRYFFHLLRYSIKYNEVFGPILLSQRQHRMSIEEKREKSIEIWSININKIFTSSSSNLIGI